MRKRAYAKLKRIRKVMTTVTDRDRDLIGYDEGLVSQRITDFDFLRKDLLEEILSARGGS